MKHQANDVLENRNGLKIIILKADPISQSYEYSYGPNASKQFQGIFNHKAVDIEQHWSWVGKNLISTSRIEPSDFIGLPEYKPTSKECSHSWSNYVGFSESYKFCTKCDLKIS